jgi:DUF1680 family protein
MHGHLIEAAISHHTATGEKKLLNIAEKAADLLVRTFLNSKPENTPGHPEIELALIKLYRFTKKIDYFKLAEFFIDNRGKIRNFSTHQFQESKNYRKRLKEVENLRQKYLKAHPDYIGFQPPPNFPIKEPPGLKDRHIEILSSGKYFQQHIPIREQLIPEGHAVRFAYLETAATMLAREKGDEKLLGAIKTTWDHMVKKRMFVTGGIGSLPLVEGFGEDYELDSGYCYCETCASLGSIFWGRELSLLTSEAKYSDLLEWQMYNGALAGIALDGKSYLYRNPLEAKENFPRSEWFHCPCCPSNISRVIAGLGDNIYSHSNNKEIWIHQYIGSEAIIPFKFPIKIKMDSKLPFQGKVEITIELESPAHFSINLRIPSWADSYSLNINDSLKTEQPSAIKPSDIDKTASGYVLRAHFVRLTRVWEPGDKIEIEFPMNIILLNSHRKVESNRGKVAITRGPLVYCLENIDNPDLDIFNAKIDTESLTTEYRKNLLNGVTLIKGKTKKNGKDFTAIPYFCWANREDSQMVVYLKK